MALADAAAFLCRQWPVFPCGQNKRPVTEHGFKDAATDPEEARRLFALPGAALIGVPTGPAADLAVVDLDIKEAGSGLDWLEREAWRLPRTRRHRTRSGGVHLLFRYPTGRLIRNSVSKLAPGVDTRGVGGYIIVPPSEGYTITDETMPAAMPDWLLDILDPPYVAPPELPPAPPSRPEAYRHGDGTAYGLAALADECSAIRSAQHGQKHYVLNRGAYSIGGLVAARELGEGFALRALEDALRDMHSRAPCDDLRHAENTLARGFRDGIAAPRQAPPDRPYRPELNGGTPHPARPQTPPPRPPEPEEALEPEETPDGGAQPLREPPAPAIRYTAEAWLEAEIPPRPWVVPGYLLRGAVTLAAGIGGAGKSSLTIGWATAAALGMDYGRFSPPQPLRVLIFNVEDDDDEQRRRLSATLRQFDRTPKDLGERVMRVSPEEIGTLIEYDQQTGGFRLTPAWDEIDRLCEAWRPDIVMLDPLAELHTAPENDNTALRFVIARIRTLARRHGTAAAVIHHFRKGGEAGDVDAIRGASAVVGAVRLAFTITPMSEEEAAEFGVSQATRRSYIRLDNAKANYSPSSSAEWFSLDGYPLDNGEDVAAALPWTPPQPEARGEAPEAFALIAAAVERGTEDGLPYSPRLAPDEPRSLAALLARHGIGNRERQKAALERLLAEGFAVVEFMEGKRRLRKGIRSATGKPFVEWIGRGSVTQ